MQTPVSTSSIEVVLADYFKQAKSDLPPVTPLYFLTYSAIQKAILNGNLEPGQSIPSQTSLARLFNVSITTVVGAVRLLTDEGLVRCRLGRGVFVLPHSKDVA